MKLTISLSCGKQTCNMFKFPVHKDTATSYRLHRYDQQDTLAQYFSLFMVFSLFLRFSLPPRSFKDQQDTIPFHSKALSLSPWHSFSLSFYPPSLVSQHSSHPLSHSTCCGWITNPQLTFHSSLHVSVGPCLFHIMTLVITVLLWDKMDSISIGLLCTRFKMRV